MFDEIGWLVIFLALLLFLVLVVEIYVVILIAAFLASWFGFSGILWWVCAIIMFGIINGLIYTFWRL